MVYRSVRPQPPRGSTEWGAHQFYRLLDDEERIAAERERLRAMGWRPPQAAANPFSDEPTFGGERDAYADLVERDLTHRRALEDEARRRATTRSSFRSPASVSPAGPEGAPGWAGGGRFGVPIPASSTPGGPDTAKGLYRQVGGKGDVAKLLREFMALLGLAEVARQSTDQENAGGGNPFDFDWGPSEGEALPPESPMPPNGLDPETERQLSQPLPGYSDDSEELAIHARPSEPIPLPDDLTGLGLPPENIPLPNELIGPVIRLTLPDIIDKFWQAGILIRGELPSTRQDNEDIIKIAADTIAECGWTTERTHGASSKERYLKGDGPGTAGSRYTDGTIEATSPDGTKVLYDFNTARKLADGRWVAYERRAEAAIRLLTSKVEQLRTKFDVYPKSLGKDRELWREEVRPYVQEAVRALLDC